LTKRGSFGGHGSPAISHNGEAVNEKGLHEQDDLLYITKIKEEDLNKKVLQS